MRLIFSQLLTQGKDPAGFDSLTITGQEKMVANMQEITGLLSHMYCKNHPYAIVPIITSSAGGQTHNTFFVCCSECKEILARALAYGKAHFQVVCIQQENALPITPPPPIQCQPHQPF